MSDNEIKGVGQEAVGHVKDAVGGLTGDASTQVDGKVDQAAGKFRAQFGDTVDDLANKASDFASRAGSTARDTADAVRRSAGDAGQKIYAAGNQAGKYVGETVVQQPLLSVLGVAAIGYLVAFFIHSPSSPFAPPPPKSRYFR
jgi:uncharacterized protein YjbJ (UPF0337 family)